MRWPRKLSLRRKLTLLMMINTVAALCVAGIGFAEYGVYRFKELRLEDLNALANIIGTNSAAPLTFKDVSSAGDLLRALAAKPHILAAAIYDRDGQPFAVYRREGLQTPFTAPPVQPDSARFTSSRVLIFQGVEFQGEKIGTIFLEGDTVEYRQLLDGYLLFFGLIVAAVSMGAFFMAGSLQRPISHPILGLAWTAKMVTSTRDYSIRAEKNSEDEVGVLIDGFNEMLQQIQKRDTELLNAREGLERRVDERTTELEQEIADRQRAQEALRVSEERTRLLLDSTAEAIIGIDRAGNCMFCNPATLRLLGYRDVAALQGKSMHDLMHHTYPDGRPFPREECGIAAALDRGEGIHSDQDIFWKSNGSSFPAEFWAYPIRKNGESVGAVITFLDITERKRAQAALLEAKEAAEAGSRAKSEFLANMSHEIRTPMNGIIGMTELALDTPLTAEQRDYLSLVKSSADSLLHIINDILDFSKIEAGKLELEETEFRIRELFRDTLKTLAQRSEAKNLELCARVSPKVPMILIGDPTRLRQLILNLVGNAIKFTEQGSIVVDAQLEFRRSDIVRLHVSVADTGMGIPKEKQQVIFESFAQVDGPTTRRFGGTGLGLTISRQLVELMGGRLWVESVIGKGSTFHFTCNFREGLEPFPNEEVVATRSLVGMNVLVVDNNQINREILSEMIANWGMHAVPAEGGAEALMLLEGAHAAGESFPIVILDALMPDMSGFNVLEQIHTQPELAGSVIMLLSANQLLADTARCRQLGVQRYLTKPVGQSELLDAILMTLGQRASTQQTPPVPTHASEKKAARVLSILLSEDNPVNQKLAIRLLEKAGHRVTLASTGREALAAWEKAEPPGFDILLMDIQMPEMDGMEATAAIREREQKLQRHVPIIAMTAHAMRGDKEKCLAAGMDGYVSKPINSADLFAEIDRCVGAPEGITTVPQKPEIDTEGQIDRASLLERVEGDQELLAEMVHLFLDDVPNLLAAMRDALQSGDMKVLERSAHSLKGAAANLSARAASAAALQLEQDARKNDGEAAKGSLLEVERAIRRLLPALAELSPGVSK